MLCVAFLGGAATAEGVSVPPDSSTLADAATARAARPASLTGGEMPMLRASAVQPVLRPKARNDNIPVMRWSHRPEARLWTRAALAAVKDHGKPLISMVPADIETWCPAYPMAGPETRAAFWVGFISALSKHESTYRPDAVGGGGLWYGLLQILPSTARLYKCNARSGAALKNGAANLSCAIRIMATTVPRDGVIHGVNKAKKRRYRGVTADWGPMHSAAKRKDMAAWLRAQPFCTPMQSVRPRLRPEGLEPPVDTVAMNEG